MSFIEFVKTRNYGKGAFYEIKYSDNRFPKVTLSSTQDIYLKESPIVPNKDQVTIMVTQLQDDLLHETISTLEAAIVQAVHDMPNHLFEVLPEYPKQILKSEGVKSKCLRPNYYGKQPAKRTMYLKGNLASMKVYNGNGTCKIETSTLGEGLYRFNISADTVYFGPHMNPKQVFNLNLRITELFYSPQMDFDELFASIEDQQPEELFATIQDQQQSEEKKKPKLKRGPRMKKMDDSK